MMDNYIEEIREQLNKLVNEEDELSHGKILMLSQRLDKLIFVRQTILVKRSKINFREQLESFLSPEFLRYTKAC